jgi:hypothetical protein
LKKVDFQPLSSWQFLIWGGALQFFHFDLEICFAEIKPLDVPL